MTAFTTSILKKIEEKLEIIIITEKIKKKLKKINKK